MKMYLRYLSNRVAVDFGSVIPMGKGLIYGNCFQVTLTKGKCSFFVEGFGSLVISIGKSFR